MIVAGIDYGRKWVGIALLGENRLIIPVAVLERASNTRLHQALKKQLIDLAVERVVVGWPLNMDGSVGPQALAVERFAEELRLKTGLPIELHDERLTTFEARGRVAEGASRGRRGRRVDALAACILLEGWLQQRGE